MAVKTIYLLITAVILSAPAGMYFMINDGTRAEYNWAASVFISLQFFAIALIFLGNYGMNNFLRYIPALFIFSILIEFVGIKTGFPFGNYGYSEILQPQIFNVPVQIGFSWIMTAYSSLVIIKSVNPGGSYSGIVSAALLLTAYDFLLEPFAAHVNGFWRWENNSIPVMNYLAWFAVSVIIITIMNSLFSSGKPKNGNDKLTSAAAFLLMGTNVFQFGLVNVFKGYTAASVTGVAVMLAVLLVNKLLRMENKYEKKFING